MEWHYVQGEEKVGPIDDFEFQQLTDQGVIQEDTLVWNDQTQEWRRYGGLRTSSPSKPTKVATRSDSESIRQEFLEHESSIRSFGWLYYLFSLQYLLIGVIFIRMTYDMHTDGAPFPVVAISLVLCLASFVAGALGLGGGTSLRQLRPSVKLPVGIVSGFGLIFFPVGTMLHGYLLWLVFSQKGAKVFSEEYQQVIQGTPNIRPKLSFLVGAAILLVGGLTLVLLAGVVMKELSN